MALIFKAATGTNLSLGASWEGGVVPGPGDEAYWSPTAPTSLGPGLTGNLSVLGIHQEGASGNIAHSAGTITFDPLGFFTQYGTNTRPWTESGTWAIAPGNSLYVTPARTTSAATAIDLAAASGITGDSTTAILVYNGSDLGEPLYALFSVRGANTGFTGQFYLTSYSNLNVLGTGVLAAALVTAESGVWITAGQASSSLGTLGTTVLEIYADVTLGYSARTLTINSETALLGSYNDVYLADNVVFAGPLTGIPAVAWFSNVGTTWLQLTLDNTANTISGELNIGDYVLTYLNCASGFNLPNASAFTIWGNLRLGEAGGSGLPAPHTFTGVSFYGDGALEVIFSATNLVSFPAGSLSGLTGTNEPAMAYSSTGVVARSGLVIWTYSSVASSRQCYVDLKELPNRVAFAGHPATNVTCTGRLYYTGPGVAYPTTRIDMILRDNAYAAQNINEIYANNPTGIVEIGEGVKRHSFSATQTLTLRGTGAGRIGGYIDQNARGALNLSKTDSGTWYLSADSNSTGTTTVSQGALHPEYFTCLGTTGAVTVNNTGTLVLKNGVSLDKSSAAFTFAKTDGTAPITLPANAQVTLATAGITLGASLRVGLGAGSKFTLSNAGAITDGASTFGIHADCSSLVSPAELVLGPASNTFDGTITVDAATLTVYTLNNIGVAGVFGTGSTPLNFTYGTLKFIGNAPNATDRGITSYSAGCTLDASGTAAATFSGPMTKAAGTGSTYTLTITGTSASANTLVSTLANATGITTSLTKAGTGYWRATGALSYTGATTVSTGTLRFERPDGNTMASAVTVASTATVELATDTLPSSGATAGRVLGTGSVTINGGIVKTRGGSVQKAQMRYGGNLTLGSGTTYYIGAAA